MNYETCEYVLMAGKNAAMRKMTLDNNLPKPDMRIDPFFRLQQRLEDEVSELKEEISKINTSHPPSPELLQAIQDEAGDVIAFASGIVSKALQIASEINSQPSLFDEWGRAKDVVGGGPESRPVVE